MSTTKQASTAAMPATAVHRAVPGKPEVSASLLTQYGCGPIHFTEADTGLYDRHLLFDNVMATTPGSAHGARRSIWRRRGCGRRRRAFR